MKYNPQENTQNIYFTSIDTSGSLNKLGEIIKQNKINISSSEIIGTIFTYTDKMEDIEKNLFKAYFMRQASIIELQSMYNIDSVEQTEQILYNAITNYLSMLKIDYSVN